MLPPMLVRRVLCTIMVLPGGALALISSTLKSRNGDAVSFGSSITGTRLDLDSDGNVETIASAQASLLDASSSRMLGTCLNLARMYRFSHVLGQGEIGIDGSVASSGGTIRGRSVCLHIASMRVGFADDGVVAARHRGVILVRSLAINPFFSEARILVKHLKKRLIGFVIKMVDLVASSE